MNDEEKDTKIAELEARIRVLEGYHKSVSTLQTEVTESLYDFLELPFIKGYYSKTLAIAYFLEFRQKKTPLTRENIKSGYIDARENFPKNFSDTIYENFRKGYFMEGNPLEDGTKTLIVTKKGIAEMEGLIKKGEQMVKESNAKAQATKNDDEAKDTNQTTLGLSQIKGY